MKKKILCVCLLILAAFASGQTAPGGVEDYSLWLQNSLEDNEEESQKDTAHFNFHPVLDFTDGEIKSIYKHLLNDQSTIFTVFKSTKKDEHDVLTFSFGNEVVVLKNTKLQSGSNENNISSVHTGSIVNFYKYKNGVSKNRSNSFSFSGVKSQVEKDEIFHIMEFISYPRFLSPIEKAKVETYLSLKYGISLIDAKVYLNSTNDTLYKKPKDKRFGHRLTGIGRDDLLNLNQKQSGNSENDGLFIGVRKIAKDNYSNKNVLPKKSFLLWSDNGGSKEFEDENSLREAFSIMERVWEANVFMEDTNDTVYFQMKIEKSKFNLDKWNTEEKLQPWLAIHPSFYEIFDYGEAKYIKGEVRGDFFVFNKIPITGNQEKLFFTFVKAPDLFVEPSIESNCENGKEGVISFNIHGGIPPYKVVLSSKFLQEEMEVMDQSFSFGGVMAGDYKVIVSDNNENYHADSLSIKNFEIPVVLEPLWYLDEKELVTITPEIGDSQNLSFQWLKEGEIIGNKNVQVVEEEGDYYLRVKNDRECEKSFFFRVEGIEATSSEKIQLYPNPVRNSSPFSVSFDLTEESEVSLEIISMEGRLLYQERLGKIRNYEFNSYLSTSGTFLLVIHVNGKQYTRKLIVF